METVRLLIKGKVQGVFYRASAKSAADRLQIRGWVQNSPEGHVEVLAIGDQANVQKFIEWCRKGPEQAVVSDVIELERLSGEPAGAHYKGFGIVR